MKRSAYMTLTTLAAALSALIASAALLTSARGSLAVSDQPQFTGNCVYSHTNDGDPIANPPPGSQHTHEFIGNDTTDAASTVDTLLADPIELAGDPRRDQCDRSTNKSAYWVPRVTWGGRTVQPSDAGVYYGTVDGLNPRYTTTTPLGFEIIAFAATSDRSEGAKAHLHWHCNMKLNVADSVRRGTAMPPKSCPDDPNIAGDAATLGVTIVFPECWDAGPFDVPGGANMRHAVKGNDGKTRCPDGFPRYVPQLRMLVDYPNLPTKTGPLMVEAHDGVLVGPEFFHADYHNAEDHSRLVKECIRQAGDGDTPAFCRHGG